MQTQISVCSFRKYHSSSTYPTRFNEKILAYSITTKPIASHCLPDYRRFLGYILCSTTDVSEFKVKYKSSSPSVSVKTRLASSRRPAGQGASREIGSGGRRRCTPSSNASSYKIPSILKLGFMPCEGLAAPLPVSWSTFRNKFSSHHLDHSPGKLS